MTSRSFAFVAPLLVVVSVEAGVVVHAVDVPPTVLIHTPAFVTFAIENDGPSPLLVPVGDGSSNGHYLYVEHSPSVWRSGRESMSFPNPRRCGAYDPVRWLKPGERWLVKYNIGQALVEEGAYSVRLLLRSNGACYSLGGIPTPRTVDCWAGEVWSETITVSAVRPTEPVDVDALAFAIKYGHGASVGGKLADAYPKIRDAFPSSHYIFSAALWRSCGAGGDPIQALGEVLSLQPANPLAPYAQMQLAITIIYESSRPTRRDRTSLPRVEPATVPTLPVLREYVAQVKHDRAERRAYEASLKSPAEAVPAPATTAP